MDGAIILEADLLIVMFGRIEEWRGLALWCFSSTGER